MLRLEPIFRRQFTNGDLVDVQESVIRDVQARPRDYLDRYTNHPASRQGHFVNSDLMKETIPAYAASRESRGRYNLAVHNSAAALAALQFRELVASQRPQGVDGAVFITGMPGSGKSTAIQQGQGLASNVWLVFEGQLAKPDTTMPKIDAALEAGLQVEIAVVHPVPEDALRNTFTRFREIGRGAGLEVLAQIQGYLPEGLEAVHEKYGDRVGLQVYDVRDRQNPTLRDGWGALEVLRSEQGYDEIKQRLTDELDRCYRTGGIDEDCYRQARGQPPRLSGLAGSNAAGRGSAGQERGREAGVGQAPLLNPDNDGRPGGLGR